jgi:predicted RNase H-like HicB family nuclease
MKRIEFSVERTNTGYSAHTTDDALTVAVVGATLAKLKANMVNALNLHFEEEDRIISEGDLQVTLYLPQFFEFYKVINVSHLAARIGMSQSLLAQYIGGHKKPSQKQTARILEGVRALGRELAAMDFA